MVRYLTVNAVGYVLTAQAAHNALAASCRGCVGNTASRTFLTGSPGQLGLRGEQRGGPRYHPGPRQGAGAAWGDRQRRDSWAGGDTGHRGVPQEAGLRPHHGSTGTPATGATRGPRGPGVPSLERDARMITGQAILCDGGGTSTDPVAELVPMVAHRARHVARPTAALRHHRGSRGGPPWHTRDSHPRCSFRNCVGGIPALVPNASRNAASLL